MWIIDGVRKIPSSFDNFLLPFPYQGNFQNPSLKFLIMSYRSFSSFRSFSWHPSFFSLCSFFLLRSFSRFAHFTLFRNIFSMTCRSVFPREQLLSQLSTIFDVIVFKNIFQKSNLKQHCPMSNCTPLEFPTYQTLDTFIISIISGM